MCLFSCPFDNDWFLISEMAFCVVTPGIQIRSCCFSEWNYSFFFFPLDSKYFFFQSYSGFTQEMNNYFARIYVINMKHTLKMKKIKKKKKSG